MFKKFSAVYIVIAACLWGSMGIFVRNIEDCGLEAMDIVAIRSIGTVFILLMYALILKPNMLKVHLKDWWCFAGTGICSIMFFNYCYFTTITRTTLSVAAVLLYTAPSFVIVFSSLLFKEKITKSKVAALVMAFTGCIFVSGVMESTLVLYPVDLMIGIGAGLGYAMYSIFGKFALEKGYSSLTITFYTFLAAGIGVLPFVHVSDMISCIAVNSQIWVDILGMVVLVTIVAYALYTLGLDNMEAGRAAIMACIEPVVATLIGSLIYAEKMTVWGICGMLLVLSSTILVNFKSIKPRKN